MKSVSMAVVLATCLSACGGSSFTSADIASGTGGTPGGSGGGAAVGGSSSSGGNAGGGAGIDGRPDAQVPDGASAGGSSGSGASIGTGGASVDGGTSTDAASRLCHTNTDCLPTELCAKITCTAGSGFCKDRPTTCLDDQRPVCSCDGVTYWNDCLRMSYGINASTNGECANNAARCGGMAGIKCPSDVARCAWLYTDPTHCNISDQMGVCWVTPPQCPAIGFGGTWRQCGPPPTACYDTCTAIQKGYSYRTDTTCPQ